MMKKRKLSDLPPVARTLLIPLAYRAIESRRPDPILRDRRAVELLESFDEPLIQGEQKPDLDQLATMLRARRFDQYARRFLAKHPDGIVVEIGCGLDTRFERLDNGQMLWFGLDLPDVIAIRRELLPETDRERLLAGSALDFDWMNSVALAGRPVIFLAEGVFPYFDEPDVRRLVLAMAERFPGAELACDVISTLSVRIHRFSPAIRKAGVHIGWGIDDSRRLETWGAGIRLLKEDCYAAEPDPRLGRMYGLVMSWPVFAKMSRILHIRLG